MLLVLLPTFGRRHLLLRDQHAGGGWRLMLLKGFIAVMTSLNVYRLDAHFVAALHLSLSVLSVSPAKPGMAMAG